MQYCVCTFYILNVYFCRSYYARKVQTQRNVRFRAQKRKTLGLGSASSQFQCWANDQPGRSPGAESTQLPLASPLSVETLSPGLKHPEIRGNGENTGNAILGLDRMQMLSPLGCLGGSTLRCFRGLLIANFPGPGGPCGWEFGDWGSTNRRDWPPGFLFLFSLYFTYSALLSPTFLYYITLLYRVLSILTQHIYLLGLNLFLSDHIHNGLRFEEARWCRGLCCPGYHDWIVRCIRWCSLWVRATF